MSSGEHTKENTMAMKPTKDRPERKIDESGRRVPQRKDEPALRRYSEEPITPVQQDFADWIRKETGYDVDDFSVALATSLRNVFQKSDDNQTKLAERRQAAADKKTAAAERSAAYKERREAAAARRAEEAAKPKEPKVAVEKAPRTTRKAGEPKTSAKTAAADKTVAEDVKAAPKSRRTTTKAAAAEKPAATTTRRRPAKPAAAATDDF